MIWFQLLGTLEQIEVIQNGIQFEGIKALAECIKHSPNLKIFNLNDNIMTPRGAISVAEVCFDDIHLKNRIFLTFPFLKYGGKMFNYTIISIIIFNCRTTTLTNVFLLQLKFVVSFNLYA